MKSYHNDINCTSYSLYEHFIYIPPAVCLTDYLELKNIVNHQIQINIYCILQTFRQIKQSIDQHKMHITSNRRDEQIPIKYIQASVIKAGLESILIMTSRSHNLLILKTLSQIENFQKYSWNFFLFPKIIIFFLPFSQSNFDFFSINILNINCLFPSLDGQFFAILWHVWIHIELALMLTKNNLHLNILILSFVVLICVNPASGTKISYHNLKQFFKATYDQNDDGEATWKQFCDYFQRLQPDNDFSFDVLNSAFNAFDANKDGIMKLQEFIDLDNVDIQYKPGHKQIHLGFTSNQGEMQVMWVSNPEQYFQPAVFYGEYPTSINKIEKAATATYNVGHLGFHGKIYTAVMKNLKPRQRYFYKVGDIKTRTFSELKNFKAPPQKNQTLTSIKFAIFGDMGTYVPFGHMVAKMIASYNTQRSYDFVFLTGDIAYAGVQSQQKGQIQPIWDLYGQQVENFAAYTAFMPGVGNHDSYYNFSSYFTRYKLPRQKENSTNLWFSFDYGQVHITYFSSENPYGKGSEQYTFLEEDFRKARENPNTKWIILGAHRPFYSSDVRGYAPITDLVKNLQQLINKYKIDIVQNGHQHCYERSWPVYQGKAQKENHNQKYYINPDAPIYVVQGTAGAMIHHKWINPAPEWSMKRLMKFGYGQITVQANYLKYEFISLPVGQVVDTWYIIKDSQKNGTISSM